MLTGSPLRSSRRRCARALLLAQLSPTSKWPTSVGGCANGASGGLGGPTHPLISTEGRFGGAAAAAAAAFFLFSLFHSSLFTHSPPFIPPPPPPFIRLSRCVRCVSLQWGTLLPSSLSTRYFINFNIHLQHLKTSHSFIYPLGFNLNADG